MPHETTEEDFDAWVAYVSDHLWEEAHIEATVDSFAFDRGPSRDTITCATLAQKEDLRDALERLWEKGCSDNFGLPRAEEGE